MTDLRKQIKDLPAKAPVSGLELIEIQEPAGGIGSSKQTTLQEIVSRLTPAPGAVISVNGRGGAVVVTKADVLLGNVDNTTDLNKPVSTATAAAIAAAVGGGASATLSAVNSDTVTVRNGTPVSLTGAATFIRAADDVTARDAIGLVLDPLITVGAAGRIQLFGEMTLATTEWDILTGMVGGLVPKASYYLSTAGTLTTTVPTTPGQYSRVIGKALSPTIMAIAVQPLILI